MLDLFGVGGAFNIDLALATLLVTGLPAGFDFAPELSVDGLGLRVDASSVAPVPTPPAFALLGFGIGALALMRRRRQAA